MGIVKYVLTELINISRSSVDQETAVAAKKSTRLVGRNVTIDWVMDRQIDTFISDKAILE